ncbi:hypothetical protein [Flavobacterium sp. XGLA_31]|uniref:hypothetical protein n=1 Tax=Flavobacterium sp. XGLA_31 TaxID=3447666 RepID=UPI003F3133C8
MKKIFFSTALILLIIHSTNAQEIYLAKYKIVDTQYNGKNDKDSKFEDLFLNSVIYNFYSNESINYLNDVQTLEAKGVNLKVSGEQHIYIDYKSNTVCYKPNDTEFFSFKELTFKKAKSTLTVLGMSTTKYISTDGNIIIYTAQNLPWYVQPCIVSTNQFNEGIVKFENLKTKSGFELIEFKKTEPTDDFKEVQKQLAALKTDHKKAILSPFVKFD